MNKEKPNLYDADEWKIIRHMYFNPPDFTNNKEDPLEKLDRIESREKNKYKNSR